MIPSILLAAVPALLAWCSWKCYFYPTYFSPLRHIPKPKRGRYQNGTFERIKDPLTSFRNTSRTPNDGLLRIVSLGMEILFVTSPAAIADVLVHKCYDFEKGPDFIGEVEHIMGHGILLAERDEHRKQRKALIPSFSYRSVKDQSPLFWRKARAMIEYISRIDLGNNSGKDPKETTVEVSDLASRVTLDIMGIAALDQDLQSLSKKADLLAEFYNGLFNRSRLETFLAVVSSLLPGNLGYALPTRRNRLALEAQVLIQKYTSQLLRQRDLELKEPQSNHLDIATTALNAGMSPALITEQMRTFLVAGHDTTASAFSWAIYLMCKHPDTQVRLRSEIVATIGSPDINAIPTPDVSSLPYLGAFCNEVLRLYPPVAFTSRITAVNTIVVGQHVPKGTYILLSPWAVNVLPSLWGEDAAEFMPERWLADMGANGGKEEGRSERSNYAFLTFLHGPRSCIGEKFAREELRILLATWVMNFETRLRRPDEPVQTDAVSGGISVKPKGGLEVVVKALTKA